MENNLRSLWMGLEEMTRGEMGEAPTTMKPWPWPSQYGYGRKFQSYNDATGAARHARLAFLPLLGLVAFYVRRAEKYVKWDWIQRIKDSKGLHPVWVERVALSVYCNRYSPRMGGAVDASVWAPQYMRLLDFLEHHFSLTIHVRWGDVRDLDVYADRIIESGRKRAHATYQLKQEVPTRFYVQQQAHRKIKAWFNEQGAPGRPPVDKRYRIIIPGSGQAPSREVTAPTATWVNLPPAVQKDKGPAAEQQPQDEHVVELGANQHPGETFEQFMQRRAERNARIDREEERKLHPAALKTLRTSRASRKEYALKNGQPSKRGGQKVYEWRSDGKGNVTRTYVPKSNYLNRSLPG